MSLCVFPLTSLQHVFWCKHWSVTSRTLFTILFFFFFLIILIHVLCLVFLRGLASFTSCHFHLRSVQLYSVELTLNWIIGRSCQTYVCVVCEWVDLPVENYSLWLPHSSGFQPVTHTHPEARAVPDCSQAAGSWDLRGVHVWTLEAKI